MNLVKTAPQVEMISLPTPEFGHKGSLNVTLKTSVFDRLVVIMAQAYDAEMMAKSVGAYLLNAALVGVQDAADKLVDELPLGQFVGWNNPERGGSVDTTPPAA